jgi:hypothetical protein
VADSFNPYRDWLGLAKGQRPTTHYGWFGLKPLESDADVIRKAISRLVAKVRGLDPGNRKRELQEIVKALSAAKACLTDPAAKAAYDAQLRAGGGAAGAVPRAVPPGSPSAKVAAPPVTKAKPGTPTAPKPTAKGSKAPSPTKASPPIATPPAAGSGPVVPPKRIPRPVWEDEWADQPPLELPVEFTPTPVWTPRSDSTPAAPPSAKTPPQADVPRGQPAPPPVWESVPDAGGPPPKQGSPPAFPFNPPPVPGPAPSYPAVPPASPPQAAYARPAAAAYPPDNMSFAPDPDANQIAIPVDVFWDPDEEESPQRSFTLLGLAITFLLSLVVLLATVIGLMAYHRYSKNLAAARARQSDRSVFTRPAVELTRKVAADPGKSTPEEQVKKKADLQKNLAELMAALARRDLAAAQDLVTQARSNAQSPDDQQTVDKYEKLATDVRDFLRMVGGRVSKFKPSEEVTLGKTRIIVVNSRDGQFSFRYGSKILNYTLETLPAWLVIALADANLGNDGPSKELYGAFLAVDPDGDRARAQSLWAEAAKLGVPIEQSLPALDSLPPAQ